jgi:UPF0755 protein
VTQPRRYRRTSRGRIWARRLGALAGLVLALALGVAAVRAAQDSGDGESQPTTTAPPVTAAPVPKPLRIVFPEGFTRRQMAHRIAEVNQIAKRRRDVTTRLGPQRYLKLQVSPPQGFPEASRRRSLEGFLFPATYEFTAKTTTRQLVDMQLAAFRANWAKLNLDYAKSKNLTPYDVLIIASMVEEEALAPEERPLVAAVIYNRLKVGMALGIDATVRYGLNVPGTQALRESHLADPTPYNTRKHAGLPPTPISNPGLASMQAAAHPKDVDYLWFVRKPDKVHHFFTASEAEFCRYSAEHGYGGG